RRQPPSATADLRQDGGDEQSGDGGRSDALHRHCHPRVPRRRQASQPGGKETEEPGSYTHDHCHHQQVAPHPPASCDGAGDPCTMPARAPAIIPLTIPQVAVDRKVTMTQTPAATPTTGICRRFKIPSSSDRKSAGSMNRSAASRVGYAASAPPPASVPTRVPLVQER